jgi:Family of unknown function (DUF5670)
MLWIVTAIMLSVWLLGVGTDYTMNGFIHLFLGLAIVAFAAQLIHYRRWRV